jgi:ABC-type nitrate/sulfonate/bicarbonate transport system permease component
MKKSVSIPNSLYPIVTILGGIFLWEGIVTFFSVPSYILPPPSRIMRTFLKEFSILKSHTQVTLYAAFLGFMISVVLAFCLAVLMDSFHIVKKALYPILVLSQTVPIIAIAPLLILWFGFGLLPKVLVVILVCFFPIAMNLADGFEKIDRDYLNLFQTLKASKLQTFYHLKLPFVSVNLFSGLKIAGTYMVMAAVIGEWMGGNKGIGVYMVRAKNAYALDRVFASIFVIVLVSILFLYGIDFLRKKIIHWK